MLAFWHEAGADKWFDEDPRFDAEIAARFGSLWQDATAGRLASWEDTAEDALALVIVLDQFPRNMFRGDPRSYQSDTMARAVADRSIARGYDQQVGHFGTAVLLSALHALQESGGPANAALRWREPTAMQNSQNMPSSMRT